MVDIMENHFMNTHTHKSRKENEYLLHQRMKRYFLKVTRGYASKRRSLERSYARDSCSRETEGEEVPFEYVSNAEKFDKIIQEELRKEKEHLNHLCGLYLEAEDSDDDDFYYSGCLGKEKSHCCDCIECCGNDWKTRRL